MILLFSVFSILSLGLASEVLEFDESNFDAKVAEHDTILVEFFAPWCGHCKRLAPEYEKAADVLSQDDPPIHLAKVDCVANADLCSKHSVTGYPTLKIFKEGALDTDYSGERTADGIIKTMRAKAGPTSKALLTLEDMEKYLKKKEAVIVGFFKSAEVSGLQKKFMKVADKLSENFQFATSTNVDVREKYGFKDDLEGIRIFRPQHLANKFEDNILDYDGIKFKDLKQWVGDFIFGLVGHRNFASKDMFGFPLVVAYYDVDYVKNPKGTHYWRNRVLKVAKKLTNEMDFGAKFAICNRDEFSHEISELGDPQPMQPGAPVVAIFDGKQKFVMKEAFSMDALEKFLRDFKDNKLEAYLKSEPIPDKNDDDLKVVVAKTFDEIVNDNSKDVLIEFYAPWCGHCKNLAPTYEKLARKFRRDQNSLTIAKMDATANDVPKPYEVRGFPTIYWAPKNDKSNPIQFSGERDLKGFVKFIVDHATDPLLSYDRDGNRIKKEL